MEGARQLRLARLLAHRLGDGVGEREQVGLGEPVHVAEVRGLALDDPDRRADLAAALRAFDAAVVERHREARALLGVELRPVSSARERTAERGLCDLGREQAHGCSRGRPCARRSRPARRGPSCPGGARAARPPRRTGGRAARAPCCLRFAPAASVSAMSPTLPSGPFRCSFTRRAPRAHGACRRRRARRARSAPPRRRASSRSARSAYTMPAPVETSTCAVSARSSSSPRQLGERLAAVGRGPASTAASRPSRSSSTHALTSVERPSTKSAVRSGVRVASGMRPQYSRVPRANLVARDGRRSA